MDVKVQVSQEFIAICHTKRDLKNLLEALRPDTDGPLPKHSEATNPLSVCGGDAQVEHCQDKILGEDGRRRRLRNYGNASKWTDPPKGVATCS